MQVLIDGTLEGLLSSLQFARRSDDAGRAGLVSLNCGTDAELTLQHARAYHQRFPELSGGRGGQKARQAVWERDHCYIRLCKEQNLTVGGFMVLNGELLAFHNQRRGKGAWMLQHALNLGANRLTCFDVPHLPDFYKYGGFREAGRLDNYNQAGPDVLTMRRSGCAG